MKPAAVAVPIGLVAFSGALALGACGSSSSTSSHDTTSAKVEAERTEASSRLDQSAQLLTSFREKIPPDVAGRSQCVVAIPSMAKGGLVVGAASGHGFASCRTPSGWSPPAPVSLGGGTFGAQIGYQSTDVVMLVTSPKGTQGLESGNFRVGVDASATAGPVGTGRGTASDVATNSDTLSYSRSQGLFAGAEMNGSTIKLDQDGAKALYGPGHDMRSILAGRVRVPPEAGAHNFMNALQEDFGTGQAPT